MILQPRQQLTIRREGQRIIVISGGRAILDMDWESALKLVKAIQHQAKLAEEEAKAEQVIADQAFAARLGLPFGFSANKAINQEAKKEAAWNSDLRKQIPQANFRGICYPPTVKQEDDS